MQRFYAERETSGPEFDDRLIQLVRANPAIYDVNHPHYRRNPVRVTIWDSIAAEMGAPSKFLQTKWKNIRYNYLQEVKCLETGTVNPNIRKRRFTEDLTFLQYTAQSYNKKSVQNNGSDNDNSNSYMYPDAPTEDVKPCEVIEVDDQSDDGSRQGFEQANSSSNAYNSKYNSNDDDEEDAEVEVMPVKKSKISIEQTDESFAVQLPSPARSYSPNTTTSPLLKPLVPVRNGQQRELVNGDIKVSNKLQQNSKKSVPATEIMAEAARRKAKPAPFPVLTPINDPIELYCLSLVDNFRHMSRNERERVKYEFSNILKDATYEDQS